MSYTRRNYQLDKESITNFITEYKSGPKTKKTYVYGDMMVKIAHREEVIARFYLEDIKEHNPLLAEAICENTQRYVKLFSEVIYELLPRYKFKENNVKDVLDVFIEHRRVAAERIAMNLPQDKRSIYPAELSRRYEVYFGFKQTPKPLSVRDICAENIGKLVVLRGIVTRCTDVKPMIVVATYVCDKCGAETYQLISSNTFIPLEMCSSAECTNNRSNGRLFLQSRGSRFMRYQLIKVQEHSDQIPVGSVPRSINVIAHGEVTRLASAGSHVIVTGVFLPSARSGFRQISLGLLCDTYLDAHDVTIVNPSDIDNSSDDCLSDAQLKELVNEENLYEKLSSSIAPEIYGHDDIKKALLLLLVGGVDKNSAGMKIRGNINILLMGDPGVAKSQLLTFIDRLSRRSQLTTGRGSSGVGLTAAVMRDNSTGEMTLEGGALVLADQGVCCIDEFDKMNEQDRTAIHEVMEQQTVSIAKAGIFTTLNARVSMLAAANPIYGRYNAKKSLEANLQLPAALLSRFDLLWLIRDQANRENDLRLARHISYVHQNSIQPPSQYSPLPLNIIRGYIAACKRVNPVIPTEISEHIVSAYVELRKEARTDVHSTFISARALLSILRLSTALAKLRLSNTVELEDVDESIRLVNASKDSIRFHMDEGTKTSHKEKRATRAQDIIYDLIKDMAEETDSNMVDMEEVRSRCMKYNINSTVFERCLNEYEELNIWSINNTRTTISLI